NGFYAFEGALHVLPFDQVACGCTLAEWNSSKNWRSEYQDLAMGCFFFAEDIFGGQFCLFDGAVAGFDPETGEKSFIATDGEGWPGRCLGEHDVLTGYPRAHEGQMRPGAIPTGQRLTLKVPSVLGGEFPVENIFPCEAERAWRSGANLAV